MSSSPRKSTGRAAQPQRQQPLQQLRQHQEEYTYQRRKGTDYRGDRAAKIDPNKGESVMVEIWLLGSVSSVEFQRLRKVVRWIYQLNFPGVSVHINIHIEGGVHNTYGKPHQHTNFRKHTRPLGFAVCVKDEFEEAARVRIAELKTAIGKELLQHSSQNWLIYGLVRNETLLYFKQVEDFICWAASEFLFDDILLKKDASLAATARGALLDKISSICTATNKTFCRMVFRVNSTLDANAAPVSIGAPVAVEHTKDDAPDAATSTILAKPSAVLSASNVEVFFEIDSTRTPSCSEIFIQSAKKNAYDGCIVHRIVPRGWIQFGDLVDGSGAHSGDRGAFAEEEKFVIQHDRAGILGMCKSQRGGSSQFYITLRPYSQFDGSLVAIGRAVVGIQELVRVVQEKVKCDLNQRPVHDCFVVETVEIFTA